MRRLEGSLRSLYLLLPARDVGLRLPLLLLGLRDGGLRFAEHGLQLGNLRLRPGLVTGPLHTVLVREWPYQDGWHWVTQDLSEYKGHRVAIEFSPGNEFDTAIAVVMLVASFLIIFAVNRIQRWAQTRIPAH